jgi:hypothetical protein
MIVDGHEFVFIGENELRLDDEILLALECQRWALEEEKSLVFSRNWKSTAANRPGQRR